MSSAFSRSTPHTEIQLDPRATWGTENAHWYRQARGSRNEALINCAIGVVQTSECTVSWYAADVSIINESGPIDPNEWPTSTWHRRELPGYARWKMCSLSIRLFLFASEKFTAANVAARRKKAGKFRWRMPCEIPEPRVTNRSRRFRVLFQLKYRRGRGNTCEVSLPFRREDLGIP